MKNDDIKKLREQLKLSQSGFAALVYANYHTVGKWENGLARPRPVSDAKLKELWLLTFGSVYTTDDTIT